MEEIRLPRTGQFPLVFEGEQLKSVSGRWIAWKEQTRWHEISLYRTKAGTFVLAIGWRTLWQGEMPAEDVIILQGEQSEMISELAAYDPLQHLIGYPDSEHYQKKQQALRVDILRRYKALTMKILEDVPGAEERID